MILVGRVMGSIPLEIIVFTKIHFSQIRTKFVISIQQNSYVFTFGYSHSRVM